MSHAPKFAPLGTYPREKNLYALRNMGINIYAALFIIAPN